MPIRLSAWITAKTTNTAARMATTDQEIKRGFRLSFCGRPDFQPANAAIPPNSATTPRVIDHSMARNLTLTAPVYELASCRIRGDGERKREQDHMVCGDHGSEAHPDHEAKANPNRQCLHCFCGCEIGLCAVSRNEAKTGDALLGAQAPTCAEHGSLRGHCLLAAPKARASVRRRLRRFSRSQAYAFPGQCRNTATSQSLSDRLAPNGPGISPAGKLNVAKHTNRVLRQCSPRMRRPTCFRPRRDGEAGAPWWEGAPQHLPSCRPRRPASVDCRGNPAPLCSRGWRELQPAVRSRRLLP